MSIAVIAFIVLLFIGFLVVIWKAVPDWRWYQITGAILTMILSIVFLFPTAGALKSRNAWHKIKRDLEKQVGEVEDENRLIKIGDPNDPTVGKGVYDLRLALTKVANETGRRWRGLQMTGNNLPNIQLNAAQDQAPVDPAVTATATGDDAAAAPAPAQPLLPMNLIVYGFAERDIQVGTQQLNLPVEYLGEFAVTATSPTQVTIQPTSQLEPGQVQLIQSGTAAKWSLYELLPLDSHEPFLAEGSSASDDNMFGRPNPELIKQLLSRQQIRPQTLQSYLYDGQRSTADDPAIDNLPKDFMAKHRWVKVQFTKNHEETVDADARPMNDGGFFEGSVYDPDARGGLYRATDARLRRGGDGKVKFKKGDFLTTNEAAANQLIASGVAELKDSYFARPLNDYRFILRRIRLRLTELADRKKELEHENKVLNSAYTASGNMLGSNQKDKVLLEQDLAQLTKEREAIEEYLNEIKQEVSETRKTLVRLYQDNISLEQKIKLQQGVRP